MLGAARRGVLSSAPQDGDGTGDVSFKDLHIYKKRQAQQFNENGAMHQVLISKSLDVDMCVDELLVPRSHMPRITGITGWEASDKFHRDYDTDRDCKYSGELSEHLAGRHRLREDRDREAAAKRAVLSTEKRMEAEKTAAVGQISDEAHQIVRGVSSAASRRVEAMARLESDTAIQAEQRRIWHGEDDAWKEVEERQAAKAARRVEAEHGVAQVSARLLSETEEAIRRLEEIAQVEAGMKAHDVFQLKKTEAKQLERIKNQSERAWEVRERIATKGREDEAGHRMEETTREIERAQQTTGDILCQFGLDEAYIADAPNERCGRGQREDPMIEKPQAETHDGPRLCVEDRQQEGRSSEASVNKTERAAPERARADILERFMDDFHQKMIRSDPGAETLWQKSELRGGVNWRSYWYNYQDPFPQRPKPSRGAAASAGAQGPETRGPGKWKTCWWDEAGAAVPLSARA